MKVSKGRIPLFYWHWQRLTRSLKILEIDLLPSQTAKYFQDAVLAACGDVENARVRLTVFRDGGGYYTPQSNAAAYEIEVAAMDSEPFAWLPNGLTVGVCERVYLKDEQFANLKTISKLPYILANKERAEKGWDECLIEFTGVLRTPPARTVISSCIAEAGSGNVFWIENNVLCTPPLIYGCIAGVTRRVVIEQLAPKIGIEVREVAANMDRLQFAAEIFVTNAVQGIRWVRKFHHLGFEYRNDVAKRLLVELNKI